VEKGKNNTEKKVLFNYQSIVGNIPFILFLSLMAIAYIFNGHYSDKLVMKTTAVEKNVKELEFEYKTIKSEVIFRSKPSEIVRAVEPLGLKELKEPAMIIEAEDSTKN
jgi:hypothetical protein